MAEQSAGGRVRVEWIASASTRPSASWLGTRSGSSRGAASSTTLRASSTLRPVRIGRNVPPTPDSARHGLGGERGFRRIPPVANLLKKWASPHSFLPSGRRSALLGSRPLSRDLRHVLDAIQAGVIVLDHLGRVDELKAPASRFLEARPQSVSGAPVERLLGADHAMARLARTVLASGLSAQESDLRIERRREGDPL